MSEKYVKVQSDSLTGCKGCVFNFDKDDIICPRPDGLDCCGYGFIYKHRHNVSKEESNG